METSLGIYPYTPRARRVLPPPTPCSQANSYQRRDRPVPSLLVAGLPSQPCELQIKDCILSIIRFLVSCMVSDNKYLLNNQFTSD